MSILDEAKALVADFRARHPGKRIAILPGGIPTLVDERPEDRDVYERCLADVELNEAARTIRDHINMRAE